MNVPSGSFFGEYEPQYTVANPNGIFGVAGKNKQKRARGVSKKKKIIFRKNS
jgi:hypothetical protein